MNRVRIWDLPTRLFHFALMASVAGALVTSQIGGEAMTWHARCGYATLSLVLFRIGWGVMGSRYARFATMLRSPRVIWNYARGQMGSQPWPGHNPLGALSVTAMLLILLTQTTTGLFANDDIAFEGPLAKLIDKEGSDRISWLHADVTGFVIYGLIGLHIAAVLFYFVRRRINLLTPMITGDQIVPGPARSAPLPAQDHGWIRMRALCIFLVCTVGVSYIAFI